MGVHNLTNLTTHLKTKRRSCATLTPGESEAAPMLGTLWIMPYVSLHPGAHLALLKKNGNNNSSTFQIQCPSTK